MQTVIGLMSGTSLDGVDAAAIETDGERVGACGERTTIPYGPALRARLRALLDRAPTLDPTDPELLDVERALTLVHVDAVRALATPTTLIGFHGQTIFHDPKRHDPGRGRTWQIGDAALLARETACGVVHDFRSADVAAGGEGAPLAPVFHAALLPDEVPRPAAVLNIGGVANLTYVSGPGLDGLLACDTGPGNALLDDWAMRMIGEPLDRDGALAARGRPCDAIVKRLLDDPFFARPAPKSLDRQSFAAVLDGLDDLGAEDGAATLVAFTAEAVARLALPARPAILLVCGGGRRNPVLMSALARATGIEVRPVETLGWDGDASEAQCFAYLAARSRRSLPLSFPGTTGVPAPCPGGRFSPPPRPSSSAR